jgi:hypothetical protein
MLERKKGREKEQKVIWYSEFRQNHELKITGENKLLLEVSV